jgi:hypothetical protein
MAASRDEENLYQRLGVAQDATAGQIESALKEKYASVEKLREQALINEDLMREKVAEAQNNYAELEKLVQFHLLNPANRKKYDDNLSSTASNSPNADAEKGKESNPWFPGIDMERHPAVPNPIIALLMILAATGKKTGRTPQALARWLLNSANEKFGIYPRLKGLAEKSEKAFEGSNDPNASQHSAGSAPATLTLEQEQEIDSLLQSWESYETETDEELESIKKLFEEIEREEIEEEYMTEEQQALAEVVPVASSPSTPPQDSLMLAAAQAYLPIIQGDAEQKRQEQRPVASFGEGGSSSLGIDEDKEKTPPSPRPRLGGGSSS